MSSWVRSRVAGGGEGRGHGGAEGRALMMIGEGARRPSAKVELASSV